LSDDWAAQQLAASSQKLIMRKSLFLIFNGIGDFIAGLEIKPAVSRSLWVISGRGIAAS
jgi:hypothetical protein